MGAAGRALGGVLVLRREVGVKMGGASADDGGRVGLPTQEDCGDTGKDVGRTGKEDGGGNGNCSVVKDSHVIS